MINWTYLEWRETVPAREYEGKKKKIMNRSWVIRGVLSGERGAEDLLREDLVGWTGGCYEKKGVTGIDDGMRTGWGEKSVTRRRVMLTISDFPTVSGIYRSWGSRKDFVLGSCKWSAYDMIGSIVYTLRRHSTTVKVIMRTQTVWPDANTLFSEATVIVSYSNRYHSVNSSSICRYNGSVTLAWKSWRRRVIQSVTTRGSSWLWPVKQSVTSSPMSWVWPVIQYVTTCRKSSSRPVVQLRIIFCNLTMSAVNTTSYLPLCRGKWTHNSTNCIKKEKSKNTSHVIPWMGGGPTKKFTILKAWNFGIYRQTWTRCAAGHGTWNTLNYDITSLCKAQSMALRIDTTVPVAGHVEWHEHNSATSHCNALC